MTLRGGLFFFLALSCWAGVTFGADDVVVREARVSVESRLGKTWTVLSGRVEARTDLPVARLVAVITDWNAYPRLFPKIQEIRFVGDGDSLLLSEHTVVSVLGFAVSNRFTLRITTTTPSLGAVSIRWTQERTDGTIDSLEGGWELLPVTDGERSGTLVRYRTVSAVPQNLPGQDGLVSWFFPGELKQIVAAVLSEARQRKEKP